MLCIYNIFMTGHPTRPSTSYRKKPATEVTRICGFLKRVNLPPVS